MPALISVSLLTIVLLVPSAAAGTATTGPSAVVVADASVRRHAPRRPYDSADLIVSARGPSHTLLRVRLSDTAGRHVSRATLRLRVADATRSQSNHGGELHPVSCNWDETVTWQDQPEPGPEIIDTHPLTVDRGDVVGFDVTAYLTTDGDHCFALTSPSPNAVRYDARESGTGPTVELVVDGMTPATCGNGVIDQPQEICDGFDDPACPGRCRGDCTCFPASSGDDAFACLAGGADIVVSRIFTTDFSTRAMLPETVVDARDAAFIHCSQPDPAAPCAPNTYPVTLGPTAGADGCWAGGIIVGANRLDASWDEMHDPNNAALAFENARFTVDGVRIHNVGDGIRPRGGAEDFLIKDVWLSRIRDDCVENDHLNGGVVDDSLFDGCFVGFSARRPDDAIDGSDNVWIIQNSLVRLESMPGPPEGGDSGHKGFFKWIDWGDPASKSPALALYSNVFFAERQGQVSADRMGIPPGKLVDCADNVMVWSGPGAFPAELPDCFTVVDDPDVWHEARARWIERHSPSGTGTSLDARDR